MEGLFKRPCGLRVFSLNSYKDFLFETEQKVSSFIYIGVHPRQGTRMGGFARPPKTEMKYFLEVSE